MSGIEYQKETEESVDMVHEKFACRSHDKGYIIREEDAVMVATVKRRIADLTEERDANAKIIVNLQDRAERYELAVTKMRLIHAILPIIICLTWILGAAEGLADPVFTAVVTAICVLWSVCNYKWGAARV